MRQSTQEQSVKIVEDFFLNSTEQELYRLLQEVLKRPLAAMIERQAEKSQVEVARMLE